GLCHKRFWRRVRSRQAARHSTASLWTQDSRVGFYHQYERMQQQISYYADTSFTICDRSALRSPTCDFLHHLFNEGIICKQSRLTRHLVVLRLGSLRGCAEAGGHPDQMDLRAESPHPASETSCGIVLQVEYR